MKVKAMMSSRPKSKEEGTTKPFSKIKDYLKPLKKQNEIMDWISVTKYRDNKVNLIIS